MERGLLRGVLLTAMAAWPLAASAQAQSATVLSIGDGDTIRVRQAGRAVTVRLACIDAPETAQSPYGQQARSYLQQRLPVGREVTLEVKTTDRYGRSVAEVISDININLAMVEDGQAYPLRGPAATRIGNTWAAVTPRSTWMPNTAPAAVATGSGRCREASPAPGTSAAAVQPPFPMAPLPAGSGTAARRSGLMPGPSSCCGKATPTSTAMAMGKPVNRCADWGSGGTGTGPSASLHYGPEGVL